MTAPADPRGRAARRRRRDRLAAAAARRRSRSRAEERRRRSLLVELGARRGADRRCSPRRRRGSSRRELRGAGFDAAARGRLCWLGRGSGEADAWLERAAGVRSSAGAGARGGRPRAGGALARGARSAARRPRRPASRRPAARARRWRRLRSASCASRRCAVRIATRAPGPVGVAAALAGLDPGGDGAARGRISAGPASRRWRPRGAARRRGGPGAAARARRRPRCCSPRPCAGGDRRRASPARRARSGPPTSPRSRPRARCATTSPACFVAGPAAGRRAEPGAPVEGRVPGAGAARPRARRRGATASTPERLAVELPRRRVVRPAAGRGPRSRRELDARRAAGGVRRAVHAEAEAVPPPRGDRSRAPDARDGQRRRLLGPAGLPAGRGRCAPTSPRAFDRMAAAARAAGSR